MLTGLKGDLLDKGIDVRFAHESLDLTSRGGRLTADIQAVIAADYVRNLREECLKGIEGRLKQGLFPFNAPIGYLNNGAGKPKTPDPARAPLVRQAFELYATQQYSTRGLLSELRRRGLKSSGGTPISRGCLENILSNSFYHGQIKLKQSSRVYDGVHEPLITKQLFDRVQAIKSNKQHKKQTLHNHTYRRLITCGYCGRSLIGELQKGHVYMRCQTKDCRTKSIRADRLEHEITTALLGMQLPAAEYERLKASFRANLELRNDAADRRALQLQINAFDGRMDKLTDALIEGLIDKEAFQRRKERFETEREDLTGALSELGQTDKMAAFVEKFLELAKNLCFTYQMADPVKKRRIAEIVFSNRLLTGKNLCLEPHNWLSEVDQTVSVLCGPPDRARDRMIEQIERAAGELLN